MLVIGERINASRKTVKEALLTRDAALIRQEAMDQARAGADYIDVNGGASAEEELENMCWLMEVVQEAVELPVCIDSASSEVIEAGLGLHKRGRAMVNSINMEEGHHESILALAAEHRALVVALAMDDTGIPRDADSRLGVVEKIVAAASKAGLSLSDVFVDPLVMALSADTGSALLAMDVVREVHSRWPGLRTTCGLSNISFGLPNRRLLNRVFLSMMAANGLDSAIVDPLDTKLMAELMAARALAGKDDFCMDYIKAHRAGRLME